MTHCSNPPHQVNFQQLKLPKTPNYYLVCPRNYCNHEQNALSPTYKLPVKQLHAAWQTMLAQQPRVTRVAADPQNYQFTYIQRTRWLHFPDTINVKLIRISDNESSIAIYSRSKYGHSDLGMNKKRVHKWLHDLNRIVLATMRDAEN